jgi:pyruvate/2-oxoglutarate dehydrogenase complex dihydrolipoamide dehydrogenase (E3) component
VYHHFVDGTPFLREGKEIAMEKYDAVIVGSGQSGGPLATELVKSGRRTALIERVHIGGTCINEGCTPTKTMIASGRVAYLTARSRDYGIETDPPVTNMVTVLRRKSDIVEMFREGSTRSIEAGGTEIIRGEARFTGPKTLEIDAGNGSTIRRIEAPWIFLNTGTRPAMPSISGLDTVNALTSTSIMELDCVPEHLLILGAGYIALEFGQLFRRLGSRVTAVEMSPRLLPREDADIAEAMGLILAQDGMEIVLNARTTRVGSRPGGGVELEIQTPDGERTLSGSHLLVAVGRSPNSEALHLPAAGVESDQRGYVKVNDRLETNVPGIYAMGEIAGTPAFTHMSYDDFRILRDNLLKGGSRRTTDRLVPYTMFTDPQLGRVGLTESQARQQGKHIKVGKMPMSHVARALEVDEARGVMKAVVDAETDQILGAAVLALEGGEVMAMFEIAMMGKLPYTALRDGIFAHPTLAESLNTLFGSLEG